MTATTPLSKGVLLELRVARLLTNEGAIVRRRVLLEPHFGEKFTLTDLDLVVYGFDNTLSSTLTIGECKTTEARNAPAPADRLLWLSGLRHLVGAQRSMLIVTKPVGPRLRGLAAALGSSISDEADLVRREQLAGLGSTGRFASHDPSLVTLDDECRRHTKRDGELHRAYLFARSELWLAPPYAAVKRALGALRIVAERYSDRLPENERRVLRWLAAELLVGTTLALVRIAADSYRHPSPVFEQQATERLSEGLADYRTLEQLSRAVDEYMVGLLRRAATAPGAMVESLGAFAPRPPAYAPRLIEVVTRLAESAVAAADAPRLADAALAAGLNGASDIAWAARDPNETGRLVRIVGAFVARQTRMPDVLIEPLITLAQLELRKADLPGSDEPTNVLDRAPRARVADTPTDADTDHPGASDSGADGPTLFDDG